MGGTFWGFVAIFAFLLVMIYIATKDDNEKTQNIIGVCSERRLFNLNELTYFKIVINDKSVTFCRVLRHENNKYTYDSYYKLYYESVYMDTYDGCLNYRFNTNDYTTIKNADAVVCSERDNFLNQAIPITEEEYDKVKQEFIKSIS